MIKHLRQLIGNSVGHCMIKHLRQLIGNSVGHGMIKRLRQFFTRSCCDTPDVCHRGGAVRIALAGNPNAGKSTVFNALTGGRQHVGNWPGVTVERKTGEFVYENTDVAVTDLPGIYSLTTAMAEASLDEGIACRFLLEQSVDVVVNIVDASNLARNLYLTVQLLELGVPVIVALNMMDMAAARGLQIDVAALAAELGCPVVALTAREKKGITELKMAIVHAPAAPTAIKDMYPSMIVDAIAAIAPERPAIALRLLENDAIAGRVVSAEKQALTLSWQQKIIAALDLDADIVIADARYTFIQQCVQRVSHKYAVDRTWTSRIDRIVLHRVLGIPIFLGVMYAMFFFAINVGGAFQSFFDMGSDTIFVGGLAQLLTYLHSPTWLTALLANGVGKGINTTITFIPVIGAMFLFLALLEDSGYMSRAAFVVDRLMRAMGLPGKSFVPMVIGFGCNVPAVMATRTLENARDRILTVMMSPFISCGARLAIYAVFVAAFFPRGGQNIVFLLYMIGIWMAILTGFLLRKTLLSGDPAPLVMELPSYHMPKFIALQRHAWQRLRGFVVRAGRVIVPVCILLGVLNALNIDGSLNNGDGSVHSLLAATGRFVTPIFAPMGLTPDNWPATVGLVTGVLAKEVVIGTLNTLYSQAAHLVGDGSVVYSFWGGLHDALMSVPANLMALGDSFGNPVLAQAPVHMLSQDVYGVMYQRFDGRIGAFAYLLFVLLYFPCISTMAVMLREVGRGWALFSACWSTGIAWCVATVFYQLATFTRHPLASALWVSGITVIVVLTIMAVRYHAQRMRILSRGLT